MKTKSILWFAVLVFVIACELPGLRPSTPTPQIFPTREVQQPLPTATPVCISDEPTQGKFTTPISG